MRLFGSLIRSAGRSRLVHIKKELKTKGKMAMKKKLLAGLAKGLFMFCMVVTFFGVSSAAAAIINIDTGFGQGADSYISSYRGEEDTNFGSEDTFYLKNDLGTGFVNRKGYLRFDLGSANETIIDATLTLSFVEDTHSTTATWGFNVYGLIDGHPGEEWLENSISWNNAPANNISSGGSLIPDQAVMLGGFTIDTSVLSAGDLVSFGSIDLVNFLLNDTDNLSTLI